MNKGPIVVSSSVKCDTCPSGLENLQKELEQKTGVKNASYKASITELSLRQQGMLITLLENKARETIKENNYEICGTGRQTSYSHTFYIENIKNKRDNLGVVYVYCTGEVGRGVALSARGDEALMKAFENKLLPILNTLPTLNNPQALANAIRREKPRTPLKN